MHGIILHEVSDYEVNNFSPRYAKGCIWIAKLINFLYLGFWLISIPEIVTKIAYHGKVVRQGPWYNRRTSHVTVGLTVGLRRGQDNSPSIGLDEVEVNDVLVTKANNRQAFRFFADMLNRLYFIFTFALLTTAFVALLAKNILRSNFEE